jgi:hypothetical protein
MALGFAKYYLREKNEFDLGRLEMQHDLQR